MLEPGGRQRGGFEPTTSAARQAEPEPAPALTDGATLQASSEPDDVVLDPFCGCGTTVAAAQALGRRWIGIDITFIAIDLVRRRLEDTYGDALDYELHGIPRDLAGAKARRPSEGR